MVEFSSKVRPLVEEHLREAASGIQETGEAALQVVRLRLSVSLHYLEECLKEIDRLELEARRGATPAPIRK